MPRRSTRPPSPTPPRDEDFSDTIPVSAEVMSYLSQELSEPTKLPAPVPLTPAPEPSRGSKRPRSDSRAPTTVQARADLLGGRYQLVDKLGQGATGTVFKGVHRDLGKAFAVKIVRAGVFDLSKGREMFLNEARTASSLVHPNIVSVTDFGIDALHGPFLVMELLTGETLRTRVEREGALPLRAAYDLIAQLLDALHFVHEREVVHCDLKPDNLFLAVPAGESRRRNYLQILDFGLAARGVPAGAGLAGTPPYLAPERILGAPPGVLTDLYSVGAVLYEMVTGRPTFQATVVVDLINMVVSRDPPPPSQVADVDERLSNIILRALSRDPSRRPPSANALLFEVRSLMETLGLKRTRARTGPTPANELFEILAFPLAVLNGVGRVVAYNRRFGEVCASPNGVSGHHLLELFDARHLADALAKVTLQRGARAWVRLSDGAKIYLARVDAHDEIQIHVMITK